MTTIIRTPITKELEAYLKNANLAYEKADDRTFRIYVYQFYAPGIKEIDPLIAEMLKHINMDCTIEGSYDDQETCGAEMMFRFDYKNGDLKKYYSEWISYLSIYSYADYKDFCEYFEDRFTEEEFEAFHDEVEYYLLDGGDGEAVREDQIPMQEYPLCI